MLFYNAEGSRYPPLHRGLCHLLQSVYQKLRNKTLYFIRKYDKMTLLLNWKLFCYFSKEDYMKKLVVYLCLGAMVFSLSACGKNNEGNESSEATVESSAEVSVEASVESTVESTQPESEAATEESATGEGEMIDISQGWSEEMEGVKAAVVSAVGADNYFPNMPVDPETMEMIYGVAPDMYDDYLAEMPMISTNVDTLLIVKAKDDKVEAVQEALNAYREMLVNDTFQYPINVGKIQASRIETFGNYVCFVQLGGDVMTAAESGDEAVIEQCQQANELALEVIGQNVQ